MSQKMNLRLLTASLCACWYSYGEAQQVDESVYRQYTAEYRVAMSALSRGNPIWCHGFNSLPWGAQFYAADGGSLRQSTPWNFYSTYYREFIGEIDTLTHILGLHQAAGYPTINVDAEFSAGAEYWFSNCMGSEQSYQDRCVPIGELCTNLVSATNELVLTIYSQWQSSFTQ
jgi:hypothetical protein